MRGASFSDDSKLQSIHKVNQEYYSQISELLSQQATPSGSSKLDIGALRYAAAFLQTSPEYNIGTGYGVSYHTRSLLSHTSFSLANIDKVIDYIRCILLPIS